MAWDELEKIPDGTGFRYRLHGRDFIGSNRCRFCREFGIYADTRCCDHCEREVLEQAETIRQARAAEGKEPSP